MIRPSATGKSKAAGGGVADSSCALILQTNRHSHKTDSEGNILVARTAALP